MRCDLRRACRCVARDMRPQLRTSKQENELRLRNSDTDLPLLCVPKILCKTLHKFCATVCMLHGQNVHACHALRTRKASSCTGFAQRCARFGAWLDYVHALALSQTGMQHQQKHASQQFFDSGHDCMHTHVLRTAVTRENQWSIPSVLIAQRRAIAQVNNKESTCLFVAHA